MRSCRNTQHSSIPQKNPFVPFPDGHCRINRLSQQILSRIFKFGQWEDLVEQEQGSYDETSTVASQIPAFELLISHVCRLWRNIALGTPSLWTTISVTITACLPYERVATYLERSKSLPLNICVAEGAQRSVSDEADNFGALLTLLVPHLSRWASIQVTVRRYDYIYTFLKAVSGPSVPPATRLEELKLVCNSKSGSLSVAKDFKFFDHFILFGGSAPVLRTLVLFGVYIDWSQGWLQSAANLQTLHLARHESDLRPSSKAFSAILLGAPKLQTLKLEESGPYDSLVEPLLLPNLSELVLRDYVPLEMTWLLRKLCIPALKTLTLHFSTEFPRSYSDLVSQLVGPATQVTASSIDQPCSLLRSLETLNIERLPCSSDSAEMLYRELVNLKVLKISRMHMPLSFWNLLSPWQPDISQGMDFLAPRERQAGSIVIFLPSLKDLFLSGVTTFELPALVRERRDAGVPLRSISMKRFYVPRLSDEIWLRDNLEKFEITEESDEEESEDSDSESDSDW